ncbi:MAG: putative membrane protein, partial [bacterium]
MVEQKRRSIVKSLSWRITGTLDTILLSWFITGALTVALSIGFFELFTKMGLYYLHERMWGKISFGL